MGLGEPRNRAHRMAEHRLAGGGNAAVSFCCACTRLSQEAVPRRPFGPPPSLPPGCIQPFRNPPPLYPPTSVSATHHPAALSLRFPTSTSKQPLPHPTPTDPHTPGLLQCSLPIGSHCSVRMQSRRMPQPSRRNQGGARTHPFWRGCNGQHRLPRCWLRRPTRAEK